MGGGARLIEKTRPPSSLLSTRRREWPAAALTKPPPFWSPRARPGTGQPCPTPTPSHGQALMWGPCMHFVECE